MSSHQALGALHTLSSTFSVAGLFLLLVVAGRFVARKWILHFRSLPYPPGPTPRMFIGNDIPISKSWITYANWGKKYGNIIHVQHYSQHIVILNSLKDATELLEKRARIYSDRPLATMVALSGWDFALSAMPYSDKWRQQRRIFQQNFRKDAAIKYRPTQTRKVADMLRSLLTNPDNFGMHIKTVAAAIVVSTVYDHDISAENDYFVAISEEAVLRISEAYGPGAAVINALPFLRHIPSWFPGAGCKRIAEECKKLTDQMLDVPLGIVKKNMASGVETTALAARLLERNAARGGSADGEKTIKQVAATAYAAGADTTVSALGSFFYAMLSNPRVQAKAQKEIDTVVGTHRLPNHGDRLSLPYIEALYREVMRWRPVLPLGLHHVSMDDDVYAGYFIPKGTYVYANIWAMNHDETVYKDPESFYPERYFDENGDLNNDSTVLAFGFGRRGCVGRHMASDIVWLTMASVLSSFNITKAKDGSGNEIPVSGEYSDGLISHPLPFPCSISPRSEEAQRLVMEAKEEY